MQQIRSYFPDLAEEQYTQFNLLPEIYSYWNNQINVVSRKDIVHLAVKHILHSLAIGKYINFPESSKVLDVGTGGGFPGIPLAILFPRVKFHLVDSIGKKIKVVKKVIETVGLSNCTAEQIRAEQLKSKYHYIVSRAVTSLPMFYQWVSKLVIKNPNQPDNGILYLKGGNINDELKFFGNKATEIFISNYFNEEFFLSKKIVHIRF